MDELERDAVLETKGKRLPYNDELDDIVKFNIAMKTLHILGQVIRNFPGSLKQTVKIEITRESYLLGLRVLSVVLGCVESHQDILRAYFARMIRDQRALARTSQLPRSAEEAILKLVQVWAFGILKAISQSVGLPDLLETYAEVLRIDGGMLSVHLVDLSIRLDHGRSFPGREIDVLDDRTRKNVFATCVLRDLVCHHFYLFECPTQIRQKYGKLLGIEAKKAPIPGTGRQREM